MQNRPKIGLALGSGVARGWAHIGVLKAFHEAHIGIDAISGTSIGALVGGLFLAGKLPQLEDWALSLTRMRLLRYLDVSMSGGGLLAGEKLSRELVRNLGDTRIEDLPTRFVPVCTELETGHEIWVREGELVQGLRASYALPGVFSPIEIGGMRLVDGALVNPVPTSVCRAYGCRLVIAVDLNADLIGRSRWKQPLSPPPAEADAPAKKGFMANSMNMLRRGNGTADLLGQLLGRGGPGVFEVMVSSLNVLQDRVSRSRLAGDPPDVMVTPHVGHIGLMEFDRAEEAIAAGYLAAQESITEVQRAREVLGI